MEKRIVILLTARALSDLQKIKNFNDELYGFDKSKEIIPKCPLDPRAMLELAKQIYYEKIISPNNIFLWEFDDYFIILLQNYFCTQFFVLNVAKATSAGKNFRAL